MSSLSQADPDAADLALAASGSQEAVYHAPAHSYNLRIPRLFDHS